MEQDLREHYLVNKIKKRMKQGKRFIRLCQVKPIDDPPYDIHEYYEYNLKLFDNEFCEIGNETINSYDHDIYEAMEFSKKYNLKNCVQLKNTKYLLAYWDILN